MLLPLSKCRRVFASLNVVAARELALLADSIFAPVRLGVVYPSAPFTLSSLSTDGSQACEDLFSAVPLPSRAHGANARGHHVRFQEVRHERTERQSQNQSEELDVSICFNSSY